MIGDVFFGCFFPETPRLADPQIQIFRAPICEKPLLDLGFKIRPWIIPYEIPTHGSTENGHPDMIRPWFFDHRRFLGHLNLVAIHGATWAKNSKFVGNPKKTSRILGCCFKKSTPFTVKYGEFCWPMARSTMSMPIVGNGS